MIFNILTTWYYSDYMLKGEGREFWICESFKYDIGIFENYTCKDVNPVFIKKEVQVSLGSFGSFNVNCMPAQFYCVIFGLFASLIGPFAGFFASGLKRAYDIKDFANVFPGHGGWVDRFDCQSFSVIFVMVMLSQFIMKEEMIVD